MYIVNVEEQNLIEEVVFWQQYIASHGVKKHNSAITKMHEALQFAENKLATYRSCHQAASNRVKRH